MRRQAAGIGKRNGSTGEHVGGRHAPISPRPGAIRSICSSEVKTRSNSPSANGRLMHPPPKGDATKRGDVRQRFGAREGLKIIGQDRLFRGAFGGGDASRRQIDAVKARSREICPPAEEEIRRRCRSLLPNIFFGRKDSWQRATAEAAARVAPRRWRRCLPPHSQKDWRAWRLVEAVAAIVDAQPFIAIFMRTDSRLRRERRRQPKASRKISAARCAGGCVDDIAVPAAS